MPARPIENGKDYFRLSFERGNWIFDAGRVSGSEELQKARKVTPAYGAYTEPRGEYFLVDPDDACFLPAFHFGVELNTSIENIPSRRVYENGHRFYHSTLPNAIRIKPEKEKEAAGYLYQHIRDAVLGIPIILFDHWHHQLDMYSNVDVSRLAGRQTNQSRESFNSHVNNKIPELRTKVKAAATMAAQLEQEIEIKFKAANYKYKKVFAIAQEYFTGEFGVDWFFDDFSKWPYDDIIIGPSTYSIWNRWYRKGQDYVIDQRQLSERHLHSNPRSYINKKHLKPMFKKYPVLSEIYHIPEE